MSLPDLGLLTSQGYHYQSMITSYVFSTKTPDLVLWMFTPELLPHKDVVHLVDLRHVWDLQEP